MLSIELQSLAMEQSPKVSKGRASPVRLMGDGPDRDHLLSPRAIMGKINVRRIIGNLMLLAGSVCGLIAGLLLIPSAKSNDGIPWGIILPLTGVALVLLRGAHIARHPRRPGLGP